MAKHQCANAFHGSGARGGCYFEISADGGEEKAWLNVGHSCVVVHDKEIPISWLAEIIAIATAHPEGIPGFLLEYQYAVGGESYALMCDPVRGA